MERRARQENADHEGPQRRREIGLRRQPGSGQHRQNGQDRERLGAALPGNGSKDARQDHLAQRDDRRERRRDHHRARADGSGVGLFRARRQQRHHRQQRNDRHVLEQEDRECGAAMLRGELVALGQELQHEGRRRQGEAEADHERRRPGPADRQADGGDRDTGQRHLQGAQTEELRRIAQIRPGSSSRPMTNRRKTTPSSAAAPIGPI